MIRAPDAAQRVALREAVRCRAGAVMKAPFGTVPALRSGMKNAAPRPGHELRATIDYFPRPFTASARLAFADPGCSGCCWLVCGAQPDSQITSKVARMRPSGSAKRSW